MTQLFNNIGPIIVQLVWLPDIVYQWIVSGAQLLTKRNSRRLVIKASVPRRWNVRNSLPGPPSDEYMCFHRVNGVAANRLLSAQGTFAV
jgi:hypothetical protein